MPCARECFIQFYVVSVGRVRKYPVGLHDACIIIAALCTNSFELQCSQLVTCTFRIRSALVSPNDERFSKRNSLVQRHFVFTAGPMRPRGISLEISDSVEQADKRLQLRRGNNPQKSTIQMTVDFVSLEIRSR